MTSCYLFSFLLGTAIIIIFSSPMVDVISKFSQQIGISAFYTSFVVTPFVSNASEVIAAIIFASRKRKKNISLTYVPTHCIAIPYQCHGVTGWHLRPSEANPSCFITSESRTVAHRAHVARSRGKSHAMRWSAQHLANT